MLEIPHETMRLRYPSFYSVFFFSGWNHGVFDRQLPHGSSKSSGESAQIPCMKKMMIWEVYHHFQTKHIIVTSCKFCWYPMRFTGWWFGTSFVFPYYWEESSQLSFLFFRGVGSTTYQIVICVREIFIIYPYIYIYTHIHIHMYIYSYISISIYTFIVLYLSIYLSIYIYILYIHL